MRAGVLWLCVLSCVACASAPKVRPVEVPRAAGPSDAVAPGTLVVAQLRQPISTARSQPGDRFSAELLDPMFDGRGELVVPPGAIVEGVVGGGSKSRIAGDTAEFKLDVTGVRVPGANLVPMQLEVAETEAQLQPVWGRSVLGALAGGAAGLGTGLAIDNDDSIVVTSSALIGAGVGAIAAYIFGPREAEIPAGSIMTFRLTRPFADSDAVARRPVEEGAPAPCSANP